MMPSQSSRRMPTDSRHVTVIEPARFVRHLRQQDVTMYTRLPDSLLEQLGSYIMATLARENHVTAFKEVP
jgi:phosphonopyruvate decarboxylase